MRFDRASGRYFSSVAHGQQIHSKQGGIGISLALVAQKYNPDLIPTI
jgi:hypothetical protein